MRRVLTLLAAGLALGALAARFLERRRRPDATAAEEPDPRTERLRVQIAATRETAGEPPAPSPGASEDAPASGDVDAARRQVHERGQAAAEAMRRSGDEG